ncbi:MAG: hypothetical protein K0S58_3160 [Nitrospira sp.]|nr:hypothetical protein [Nitrospira sp.]
MWIAGHALNVDICRRRAFYAIGRQNPRDLFW